MRNNKIVTLIFGIMLQNHRLRYSLKKREIVNVFAQSIKSGGFLLNYFESKRAGTLYL